MVVFESAMENSNSFVYLDRERVFRSQSLCVKKRSMAMYYILALARKTSCCQVMTSKDPDRVNLAVRVSFRW